MISWFSWAVVLDTGVHVYEQNRITGKRRIRRITTDGYQPMDLSWVETGVFSEPIPPQSK